jgi:hypothetical protein
VKRRVWSAVAVAVWVLALWGIIARRTAPLPALTSAPVTVPIAPK